MHHEPSRIQQEGRAIEVFEEIRIEPLKYSQGESGKVAKACRSCGRSDNRRPRGDCRCHEQKHNDLRRKGPPRPSKAVLTKDLNWFPCSCCLAKIGCGAKTSAKILKMSHGTIQDKWTKNGIYPQRPRSGNWKQAVAAMKNDAIKAAKMPTAEEVYETYWMEEIEFQSEFNEWECHHFEWAKIILRRLRQKRYARDNPEKRKAVSARWKANNPQRVKELNRLAMDRWKERDPVGFLQARREAGKKQRSDPRNRPRESMRKRFRDLMRGVKGDATSSFSSVVGCTRAQFKKHLEVQFKRGMTWENYGTHWHVDHILPCASFDHSNPRHVKQCWHYTNLRPLEAEKNIIKSDTITEPQMSLLLCATY